MQAVYDRKKFIFLDPFKYPRAPNLALQSKQKRLNGLRDRLLSLSFDCIISCKVCCSVGSFMHRTSFSSGLGGASGVENGLASVSQSESERIGVKSESSDRDVTTKLVSFNNKWRLRAFSWQKNISKSWATTEWQLRQFTSHSLAKCMVERMKMPGYNCW